MLRAIITSPSLSVKENVSGVSTVTSFITTHNTGYQYVHFTLGKKDGEARDYRWLARLVAVYVRWIRILFVERKALVHFNVALEQRSLTRDLPLIIAARWWRRRIIIHLHGGEFFGFKIMPESLKRATAIALAGGPVIVLSETERQVIESRFPKAKAVVLPNCVDLGEATSFDRSYPDDEPVALLFLGRISVLKGIKVLYDAVATAMAKGIRFRFMMAGAGPDADAYVARFRELLGDRFVFSGVVRGAAKERLLRDCHVLILPSFFEGLPMALLESMAFGMVPIATAVGSIPSVVSDGYNGILVGTNDHVAIVDALERLSSDRMLLRTLSTNSRNSILRHCNPADYIARLRTVYETVYQYD